MKIVTTSDDVKRIEEAAKEQIPSLVLMESAALQCWLILKDLLTPSDSLLFLVGGGNNGGDGLAIARFAYDAGFKHITILHSAVHFSDENVFQQQLLANYPIKHLHLSDVDLSTLPSCNWIIDALTGLGMKGPLKEGLASLVEWANGAHTPIFSVDIPSGLGDDGPSSEPSIHATYTVALGSLTQAHYHPSTRWRCGTLRSVNPSFPSDVLQTRICVASLDDDELILKPLKRSAYKKDRGSSAIFGSSRQYPSAARLSAKAAFAARGGLVTLYCDEDVYQIAAVESPSVIVREYTNQSVDQYDAILAGPGWGNGREEVLLPLLNSDRPLVLDADAIHAYASLFQQGMLPQENRTADSIFTPHLGELRVLGTAVLQRPCYGPDESPQLFFANLSELAQRLGSTLVVKSSIIHLVDRSGAITILESLNPSLGVGGSGDVLAGVITALLGQGYSAFDAALLGCKIHIQAGKIAHEEVGYYDSEVLCSYIGKVVLEAER
ncbi:MAG: NAD(P)H-hydrate dehydratase [Sphaerochaeta sp.]